MRVGINICGAVKNNEEQLDTFVLDCFNKVAQKNPEQTFFFITDGPVEKRDTPIKNTIVITIAPRPANKFFRKLWYKYTLENILKKQKIDLLLSVDGICSLHSKITQFLWINDWPVLHSTPVQKDSFRFYKRDTAQFLHQAKGIAMVSSFLKKETVKLYKIKEQKIDVIYSCIDERFEPVSFEEKEQTKEKYTQGKEYFLYAGDINPDKNLITLLKAFSFFKKRQKSNMQLLLLSNNLTGTDFTDSLKTYKYREEVKLLLDLPLEEQVKITASAYAFVYPSLYESFPKKILEALQCGVPAIANYMDPITEICAGSVLYTNTNNFEEIADKMMLLFKDENKRSELIIKGNKLAAQYNLDKAADLLWQSIIKTTHT